MVRASLTAVKSHPALTFALPIAKSLSTHMIRVSDHSNWAASKTGALQREQRRATADVAHAVAPVARRGGVDEPVLRECSKSFEEV